MDLSGEEEHLYRYCVVVILNNEAQPCLSQHSIVNSEANGRQKVIVRRWETHLVPRYGKIGLSVYSQAKNYKSLSCRKIPAHGSSDDGNVERFGDYGGRTRVQRGWLAEEMLIQFKLCPGAVTLYKR